MRTNFAIPSDVLQDRWAAIIEQIRADLDKLPRRRFIKRRLYAAMIATYRIEVEDLESLIDTSERALRLGRYGKFEAGTRVQANQNAGFHRGAIGTVTFQEPGGLFRVWVMRDGASSNVFYYPDELDLLDA